MFSQIRRFACPIGVGFVVALIVGIFTTWPLTRHAHEGISAIHRSEIGSMLVSIPGDHLQLLYFFQLTRNFLTGETPWFHNVYEFNTGDDSDRLELDFYYMPFSLMYAAFDLLTENAALAWNMTGLLSLWIGAVGIFLLVGRFSRNIWVVVAATVAATAYPYRLITFLHGSPTGFGISYVPFLLLGLDIAIRDKKMRGALLAGIIFFLAEGVDLHTYFFMGLLIPFWCAFVYLYDEVSFGWSRIRKTFISLIPFMVCIALVMLRVWIIRLGLKDSVMAGGRTVTEVAQFSPSPHAYWTLNPDHPSSYVYQTFLIPVMVLLGMVLFTIRSRTAACVQDRRRLLLSWGLFAGMLFILLLGLGPRMPLPRSDRLWEYFVRLIPPYRMIRQPPKVLALLPSLLAVLMVLPFSPDATAKPLKSRCSYVYGLFTVLLLGEVAWRMDPAISLMGPEQRAYAAVVANAEQRGEVPRALGIVLWPGDTHWSSLFQHYGIKYRIRMINGYSPSAPLSYFDEVFMRFASINRGYATEEQLNALLGMGIRYIILHEDAFPERVSMFGVAQTLAALLKNPRIRLMEQDRAVWSFEIMEAPHSGNALHIPWETASASHWWDMQWHASDETKIVEDAYAHGGHFVQLSDEVGSVALPIWGLHYQDRLRLMVRARGLGMLQTQIALGDVVFTEQIQIETDDWDWYTVHFPAFNGFLTALQFMLESSEGTIDVDHAVLVKGVTPERMAVGDIFRMPAPTLFRAGFTDLQHDAVVFEPSFVPPAYVLYGPRLPLPAGEFVIRLRYRSESDEVLGTLGFRSPLPGANPQRVPVRGSKTYVEIPYVNYQNLPFTVAFLYSRAARMVIESFEIERIR